MDQLPTSVACGQSVRFRALFDRRVEPHLPITSELQIRRSAGHKPSNAHQPRQALKAKQHGSERRLQLVAGDGEEGVPRFDGVLQGRGLTARNTVVVSPGRLDRSPCGTGTSARLAVMHARRQIRKGQPFDHESVIGSHFLAEIVGTTRVGRKPAVVTTVAGRGWVTDIGQYGCDPEDPFPEGYTLSDTWLRAI